MVKTSIDSSPGAEMKRLELANKIRSVDEGLEWNGEAFVINAQVTVNIPGGNLTYPIPSKDWRRLSLRLDVLKNLVAAW